jgi:hypothetical protein
MAGAEAMINAFQRAHEARMEKSRNALIAWAAEIANTMKQNARWTDRTSNARNSLTATTEFTSDVLKLIAQGGGPPDYVVFLELAMAGRYAIIRPTLELYAGKIHQDLCRIWGGK